MKIQKKIILDKDVKKAILLKKLPRSENINPIKKLDDFLLELLKQNKKNKKKTMKVTINPDKVTDNIAHYPNCGF